MAFPLRGMKYLCARDCKSLWLCHHGMDRLTPKSRQRFLEKVRKTFAAF